MSMLIAAAVLLVLIGFAHSVLGEKYILTRLFKLEKLPRIMGSDTFTRQTLRFAWHLTTVAWWGFAAVVLVLSDAQFAAQRVLLCISATFFISGFVALTFSRARHLSWIIFWTIAALTYFSAR